MLSGAASRVQSHQRDKEFSKSLAEIPLMRVCGQMGFDQQVLVCLADRFLAVAGKNHSSKLWACALPRCTVGPIPYSSPATNRRRQKSGHQHLLSLQALQVAQWWPAAAPEGCGPTFGPTSHLLRPGRCFEHTGENYSRCVGTLPKPTNTFCWLWSSLGTVCLW